MDVFSASENITNLMCTCFIGLALIKYTAMVLSPPACHPGFYKSYAGNIKCSKCPPHSYSYGEGCAICHCQKGYFRAEKDPPTMACTREYTSHQGFMLTYYLCLLLICLCCLSDIFSSCKTSLISRTYLV